MVHKGLPVLEFARQQDWESWLTRNHESPGLWLKIAKKGSGIASVTYEQALEVALCFGWIDGQKAPLDERHWLQRFTPRSPKGKWSQINRSKAEDLIARGRMMPSGLEQVQKARLDGRWEAAYEGQSTARIPDDLAYELARNPRASEFFGTLNSANRYAILYRVQDAKLPATRARRIAKFIAMLEAGEKIHP